MPREMKDSGIEWIGEIPSHWHLIKNKNAFLCKKEIVGEKSSETQLLSLTTRGVRTKSPNAVGGKVPESFDTYQYVEKDDLIMCLFDLDCSAVFSGISSCNGMISPAYKILKCKASIIPSFASYWFSFVFIDRKFKPYAKNLRYTLTYEEFATLSILAPTLSEQQAISDFLDKKCAEIDAVIEQTEATIEEYKKLKQSVITEAVTKGIRGDRPMKDSGIEWIGEIPSEWKMCKTLYALSMPITDGPHTTPELYDTGVPFVSAEAVSCGKGTIAFDHIRGYISEEFYQECCLKYIPKINDIYMIKSGATTGKVAYVDTDIKFNIWSPLAVFRVNEDRAYFKYFFYYLQSDAYQQEVQLGWTYGTQQNIGMRTLETLKVLLPLVDEQIEIADYLDQKCAEIDPLIEKKTALLEEMEALKKSIIFEYVTGKKEVAI